MFNTLSEVIEYYQEYHLTKNKYQYRADNLGYFDNYDISELKKVHVKEYAKFTGSLNEPTAYLGCWATLTRKGRQVFPHTHSFHNFHMIGHVSINAEPSTTTYLWKDSDNKEYQVPIENINGAVQVTRSVNHHSSVWEKDEPRVTIAFDVIGDEHVKDPRPLPPCFPILLE